MLNNYFELNCAQLSSYFDDETDCWTVALANHDTPEPEFYLILQRAVDDDEPYYYELGGLENSAYGGFAAVCVTDSQLTIHFTAALKQRYEYDGIVIHDLDQSPHLSDCIQHLGLIFNTTDCDFATDISPRMAAAGDQ